MRTVCSLWTIYILEAALWSVWYAKYSLVSMDLHALWPPQKSFANILGYQPTHAHFWQSRDHQARTEESSALSTRWLQDLLLAGENFVMVLLLHGLVFCHPHRRHDVELHRSWYMKDWIGCLELGAHPLRVYYPSHISRAHLGYYSPHFRKTTGLPDSWSSWLPSNHIWCYLLL